MSAKWARRFLAAKVEREGEEEREGLLLQRRKALPTGLGGPTPGRVL